MEHSFHARRTGTTRRRKKQPHGEVAGDSSISSKRVLVLRHTCCAVAMERTSLAGGRAPVGPLRHQTSSGSYSLNSGEFVGSPPRKSRHRHEIAGSPVQMADVNAW